MYCSNQDIINDFKKLDVQCNGTVITESKLDDLIEQESFYIDSMIGSKYMVPASEISSPSGFSILKRICIFRVSLRVRNILEIRSDATQNSSEEKFTANGVRTPNDDLMAIKNGKLVLIDVPRKGTNLGIQSGSKQSGVCSPFKVGEQQW
jgi:hypothetical protein